MSTTAVDRLNAALEGRYHIERELGEGGMATVYLADDLRHERKVALKVLKPELAAVVGAERFLAEIKTTANLQHPHILPLFDSGEADAFLFYVMPYVEGESLRERLDREKQLPVDEAVRIASDVAEALDYAHAHGVVHRDIKPANILLQAGRPVVADFGIALAVSAAGGARLTETGLSLGTPHYMSPEQATGERELDSRSDVYSLSAMLYEMLAGQPPFMATRAQAVIAKILTEEPTPVQGLRASVPRHVDLSIQRALAKLPADRFTAASAFKDALNNPALASEWSVGPYPAAATPSPALRFALGHPWVGWAVPLILIASLVIAAWGWMRPASPPLVARLDIGVSAGVEVVLGATNRIQISRDGAQVVFAGRDDESGIQRLYRRPLDALGPQPIVGTDGATLAFFSPDGESIGFFRDGQLFRLSLSGGQALTITDSPEARGASWGDDGYVVFAPTASSGLSRVPAVGGTPQVVTELDRANGEASHRWPQVLPGSTAVLYTSFRGSIEASNVAVVDLTTGEVRRLIEGAFAARYSATGHLLYANAAGSLIARPFDIRRLEVTGEPTTILDGVVFDPTYTRVDYDLSDTGTLVYATGETKRRLVLADPDGGAQVVSEWMDDATGPRLSPDATRVAVSFIAAGKRDVWILDLQTQTRRRLTVEGNSNWYPEWSPDGSRVVFSSDRAAAQNRDLFWKPVDGSGSAQLLVGGEHEQWEASWPREGRFIVYRERDPDTGRDLWVLPLDGDSVPLPYLKRPFDDRGPAVSPDGRSVAFVSDESGRDEVYVGSLPQPETVLQVSNNGGLEPRWSPDGRELFYRDAAGFVAASVAAQPSLLVGTRRRVLDDNAYGRSSNQADYDVHPDGRLLVLESSTAEQARLIVVLNFFDELRRLVPN